MHTARIPPVDPAPASITAVLAMHAGHICLSSELLIPPRLRGAAALPLDDAPLSLPIPDQECNWEHTCTYTLRDTFGRSTSALTSWLYRLAQRHIPRSGAMIVLPSRVNEYSKVLALDLAACRVINPVDSRLR